MTTTKIRDAAKCGTEDAEGYLAATDETPEEIARIARRMRSGEPGMSPDEGLINGMGRGWVLAAAGAPDESDDSWYEFGEPWCAKYNEAYIARLEEP